MTGRSHATATRSVEDRLVRLERNNRALVATLAAALCLFVFIGAGPGGGEVVATSLRIMDHDGQVRAEITVNEDGPLFSLKDETGNDRIRVVHGGEETGLFISDEEGTTRVGIAQFAHGGGGVALHGPQSKGAAVLYLKGEGSLRFFDGNGNVTARVSPRAEEN
jgi:hypothetical protein